MSRELIEAILAVGAIPDYVTLTRGMRDFTIQDQNVGFPSDLKTAYIHMRFSTYSRRSIYEQPFFNPQNSIRLPIPNEIVDSISVDYTSTELGPVIGAAVDAFSSQPQSTFGERAARNVATAVAAVGAEAITRLSSPTGSTTSQADIISSRDRQNALSAAMSLSGVTINPFHTILFKSPKFKKHRFSWKLIPKNEQESKSIELILRLFKYHMLPGLSAGTVFFSYPEILEIKLFPKDDYLYKFKPCVVESVSVNYAPNRPSFYRSGAPTAVEFSVNLQEIEIWTKSDYVRDGRGIIPQSVTPNPLVRPRGVAPNLRAGIE